MGQIVPKGVRRTRRCATNAWEALEEGDEKMAERIFERLLGSPCEV